MSSQPAKPSNAPRYLFLFLLGLVIGIIGVVMVLRAIEGRKTWQDRFPEATMHVLDAHVQQLRAATAANRCNATDVLPHLQALRTTANDLDAAFPELADDQRFQAASAAMRAATDKAVSNPPLSCEGIGATMKSLGEGCKGCHQDFKG